MKFKTLIIFAIILLIIILTGETIYLCIIGVESKPTKNLEKICVIKEETYQDRKIFTITKKDGIENDTTILYFHGGSYVAELSKEHWNFIKDIAVDTGCTIIVPDYPLTPKYNYEDVEQFSISFYEQLIQKIDTEKLIIMGDSAGGGLALGLCEKLGEKDLAMPNKLILISPWLDTTLSNSKIDEVQKLDKDLNKETLKLAGIAYTGENGINSNFANPILGLFSKLPETIIYTGTNDILNPDVSVLVEKANQEQKEITVKEEDGKGHIWIIKDEKERKQEAAYIDLINIINNSNNNANIVAE